MVFWNPTELSIRLVGLLLQLCGISTVFWGIISLISRVKAWLGSLRPVVGVLSSGEANDAAIVRAYVTYGPGANITIETRLDALEKNVTAMDERITKEIEEQFRKLADTVKREEQSRQDEDAAIRENLEAKVTEGGCLTLIGALWILVGTILSTVSGEIHYWIAGFPYFGM
jgi:hypothetical protein